MEFNENMIGKRVREIDTGDVGTIVREGIREYSVYVQWDEDGELWIPLEDIVFIENQTHQEITIDGKRYKLTPLD